MTRQKRFSSSRGNPKKTISPSGKMTRAQAISTFGVGSIFELRHSSGGEQVLNSVMVAGLDEWNESMLQEIHEPTLERALGVSHFYLPPELPDDRRAPTKEESLPAYRFPAWMVCSDCQTLGTAGRQFNDQRLSKPTCNRNTCDGHGVPARLVTSCSSADETDAYHPGHISEFPWSWWAHSLSGAGECDTPSLKLLSTGESAGLAGLEVKCTSCGEKRNLQGVFAEGALSGRKCFGRRPWLNDEEECRRPIRVLMRGASNIYFPVTASAISIPPYSTRLFNLLSSQTLVTQSLNSPLGVEDLIPFVMQLRGIKHKYTEAQVRGALDHLRSESSSLAPISEAEQKAAERSALCTGTSGDEEDSEFEVDLVDRSDFVGAFQNCFSNLAQVRRLREVRALRGFSRIFPASGGDAYSVECAPLSKGSVSWLPAMEVRGEGIYFELDFASVVQWAQRPSVQQRHQRIERRWLASSRAEAPCPAPGFILLHTFAHAIMNRLALECGYSSASLRERVYVSEDVNGWFGALIYTAVPGADGTLGGLVSHGASHSFFEVVGAALREALWCSSDPLCIDLEGQGADALNQAACHACVITSETSCEFGNALLDRAYLCGTDDEPDLSFFNLREFAD